MKEPKLWGFSAMAVGRSRLILPKTQREEHLSGQEHRYGTGRRSSGV